MTEATLGSDTIGVTGTSRVVLVHGFTQTRRCWGPIADDLARDHEVVLVDAPGHGGSSTVEAGFEAGADLIGAAGGRGTYVGYSMGGRYCLQLASAAHRSRAPDKQGRAPDLVDRLVLVGASPGLADDHERAARIAADRALADRIEAIGVDAFVDEWVALPLFAGLDPTSRHLDERRTNTASGLASSLRTAGTGEQPDLWPALAALAMPILLVTGERDAKFTAIAEQMVAAIGRPTVSHHVIPNAGHTAHLEQPAAFLAALRRFL